MTKHLRASATRPGMGQDDVDALIGEVRDSGLDLRRTAVVTFLVAVGDQRDAAFAMMKAKPQPRWSTAVYGDATGWLVRVAHRCRLTPDALQDCLMTVIDASSAAHGLILEVTVEDLRTDDCWAAMAQQISQPPHPEQPTDVKQPTTPPVEPGWPQTA